MGSHKGSTQSLQSDCSDVQVYKWTYIKNTVKHRGFFDLFELKSGGKLVVNWGFDRQVHPLKSGGKWW